MVLCPICNYPCDRNSGKTFNPKKDRGFLHEFCAALGVPLNTFQAILTQRYICYRQFPPEAMDIVNGKRHIKMKALPNALTEDEKAACIRNNNTPHRSFGRKSSRGLKRVQTF